MHPVLPINTQDLADIEIERSFVGFGSSESFIKPVGYSE
jgi:hypothetical protein